MIQALIGKKIEQTQRFLRDGKRIPVTILAVPAHSVVQVKTTEKEGYSAVQIGIGTKKKPSKPLSGHIKKANLQVAPTVLREVKLVDESVVPAVGDTIAADAALKAGDIIKVSGIGKGKGFQGGVKRHNFKGGPRTHGQSDRERAPGSLGQTTTPGRVYKGKRMAGHMGSEKVTISNLVVVSVDKDTVLVKGLVPGVLNSTVYIQKTGELKAPLELYVDPNAAVVETPAEETPSDVTAEESVETAPATDDEAKEVKSEKGEVVPAEAPTEATETKKEEKEEQNA